MTDGTDARRERDARVTATPAVPAVPPTDAALGGPPPPDRGGAGAAVTPPPSARNAALVAAGIFLSRIAGLVRQRVFASYFAIGTEADAFSVAMRLPNLLQNLFGEGALSASFIPVYAALRARGERDEAQKVAGAVFALLALAMAVFVLGGVLLAPVLVSVFSAGLTGATKELTIQLTRIFFPGSGLLVMSAWCLGILNSHRRFFLSYVAPVVWNAAIIAALLLFGGDVSLSRLAIATAWGAVVGSALQFLVQLPVALSLLGSLRLSIRHRSGEVREVMRNFTPALMSRGVAQLSGYIDLFIASYLIAGSVATMNYAQALYLLPVSLFGLSMSAAELPEMSSLTGERRDIAARLRERLTLAKARVAFFIVPSVVAFVALGDVAAATIYQSGRFGAREADLVWGVLAAAAVGLLAGTLGRLYSSTLYAFRDTRTPFRFAVARVALAAVLGAPGAFFLPRALGLDPRWGVAGLTLGSAVAGWAEYLLLRRAVADRIGSAALRSSLLTRLWGGAALAAAAGWGVKLAADGLRPLVTGVLVFAAFGVTYIASCLALGVPQASAFVETVRRRLRH